MTETTKSEEIAVSHSPAEKAPESSAINDDSNTVEKRKKRLGDDYVTIELSNPRIPSSADHTTTMALDMCKRVVLKPYLSFLKVPGWRSVFSLPYQSKLKRFANVVYPGLVVAVLLLGYVIQFAACYSRSHPAYEYDAEGRVSCYSHSITTYFIPDLLHLVTYFYCLYFFRIVQNEQLETLMETTFLQSSFLQQKRGHPSQNRLTSSIRWFLWAGICWIVASLVAQTLGVAGRAVEHNRTTSGDIEFTWMGIKDQPTQWGLAALMLLAFVMLDIVYIAVVVNYVTQCNLLIFLIHGLNDRLKEKTKTYDFQKAIKEYTQTGTFVRALNSEMGIAVSLLEFNFGTLAISAFLSLGDNPKGLVLASTILSIVLWTFLALLPFFYAARVSSAFETIRKVGIRIRTRPFGYQDVDQQDLDSFLLFTMAFRPRAKIFRIPVMAPYVWGFIVITCFIVIILGQHSVLPSGVF
ncbi:uncharacterized protein [Oscarella lobularis]|uniref:uncharacterized protein n=1 Tax=Oscarella lobularis TaxID=121494 RepID=UPI0033140732